MLFPDAVRRLLAVAVTPERRRDGGETWVRAKLMLLLLRAPVLLPARLAFLHPRSGVVVLAERVVVGMHAPRHALSLLVLRRPLLLLLRRRRPPRLLLCPLMLRPLLLLSLLQKLLPLPRLLVLLVLLLRALLHHGGHRKNRIRRHG